MPIKPENLKRYPADWPAIRAAILERARNRCEHRDGIAHRCCAEHRALGYWRQGNMRRLPEGFDHLQRQVWTWVPLPRPLRDSGVDRPMTLDTNEGPLKVIRIVLTIAHLNHEPEDCRPENLAAMCQRHHLAYDRDHHRANAQATRRARAGTLELF
jgi:hypothetical protein